MAFFLLPKIKNLFIFNQRWCGICADVFLSVISEYLNILSAHIAPKCANNNFCKKNTFLIIFLIIKTKKKGKILFYI